MSELAWMSESPEVGALYAYDHRPVYVAGWKDSVRLSIRPFWVELSPLA